MVDSRKMLDNIDKAKDYIPSQVPRADRPSKIIELLNENIPEGIPRMRTSLSNTSNRYITQENLKVCSISRKRL